MAAHRQVARHLAHRLSTVLRVAARRATRLGRITKQAGEEKRAWQRVARSRIIRIKPDSKRRARVAPATKGEAFFWLLILPV